MSNRFHNKFHRVNHHSVSSPDPKFPDAGYDPIASFESPFQGEFFSEGDIITTQNLSAGINLTVDNNALIRNNLTVGYDAVIGNDLLVHGDFTVLGTTSQVDTLVYVTSAMDIVNVGTGPALSVNQTGNEIVAQFLDDGIPALHVSGLSSTPGFIGINTDSPNEQLTIVGNLSTQGSLIVTESVFISGSNYIDNSLVVKDDLLYADSITDKVGINTKFPNKELTVVGSISATENLLIDGNTTLGSISAENTTTINGNVVVNSQTLDDSFSLFNAGSANSVFVQNSATFPFVVKSFGSVGIGTSSPNEELTVVGSISATENLYVGGETKFNGSIVAGNLVVFNTVSAMADSTTLLPTNGNDIEIYSSSTVMITSFENAVKGAMYSLTNKGSHVITLSSSPSLFVRNGTAWLSNTYTLSTAFLQLPPNYSCSLRAHDLGVVSVW